MSPTSPRHIAFFLTELRDGGVPRQTLQLSAELARRGHRVTLLPAISGGVRERNVDADVRLARLDAGPISRSIRPSITSSSARRSSQLTPLI